MDLSTNLHENQVTWDKYSLIINGQRQAIFSGEFHPYRFVTRSSCLFPVLTDVYSLPVHDFYLDVFQKIKSAGFTAVSFYTFWGLHEPKRGAGIDFSGFRNVEPFIQAAQQAGLYLIARPGPYINAETTGGGFPGWGARDPSLWRTSNSSYVQAYQAYVRFAHPII
jgi:beta-galactosidase GanA